MTRRKDDEARARGTTQEWIERAHAGGESAACLARAEGVARGAEDWNALAVAWMELADAASARRCVEAALESARGKHWPSREAAEFLAKRLGDQEAAGAALGRIETRLRSRGESDPPRAYEWVMLARAYREVLDQTDAVHRCLVSAAASASTPDDFTEVARGSASLGGEVEATRGWLERAERLARERGEPYALSAVAERWMHDLHDAARARSLLEQATTGVSTLYELTRLAYTWWWMFRDAEAMRRALVWGEKLATSPEDWVMLASAYDDGGQDSSKDCWAPEAVRRCLEAALTTQPPPTRAQRERIAVGFGWLGETARALEIAPPRRSMEEMVEPVRRLEEWPARDSQALLDRLREQITSEDLEVIAKADYGFGWESYQQTLLELKATGIFLLPLDMGLRDVLSLTRWSGKEEISHPRRAFVCTVLGLDTVLPDSHQEGALSDTLAPLLESSWALGLEDELELFLVWLVEAIEQEHELPWALSALALALARRDPKDPRLGSLAARLEALEESAEENLQAILYWDRSVGFSDLWRSLTVELFDPKRGVPPSLERLALLLPESPDAPRPTSSRRTP